MPSRIGSIPPITRVLFVAIIVLSALNATLRFSKYSASLDASPARIVTTPSNYLSNPKWAVQYLVLVPESSIIYPWTALTATFVENNVVSLAISLAVIWFGGRYLERAWGSSELSKFVLFVAMIPNILSFAVYALWHLLTSTPPFPTPIQGLVALEAGFLVGLKQLVPEHTVSLFRGLVRIRLKHLPALFALANILSGPVLGTDTALWLSLLGFLTAWIYLRFFRLAHITVAATGGEAVTMKGDASDTFAFVAFFPDVMHPFLAPVGDAVHAALVRLGVLTPFSEEDVVVGNENAASRGEGLPSVRGGREDGERRGEAERRRALALRALNERLSAAAAARSAEGVVDARRSLNEEAGQDGDAVALGEVPKR